MPKKTKRVQPKAKPQPKRTRHALQAKRVERAQKYLRSISLEDRKTLITDALEAFVVNAPAKHRIEIAEHISDIGIELVGFQYGVSTEHATVVFPDDNIAALITTIDAYHLATQIPPEQIIDRLIEQLNVEAQRTVN